MPRVNNVRSQEKQWRSTIPVWSPYRSGRHWFAAWELGRRLLLTGLLVLVPDGNGEEMYMRTVVGGALAGVSLAVGELARPHRDPWIRWIYRTVRKMVVFSTAGSVFYFCCERDGFPAAARIFDWGVTACWGLLVINMSACGTFGP